MPFPAPTLTQTVFVSKAGNDTTGTGALDKPFLTINKALTSITDASTAKRYVIYVFPGTYAETSFALKPFVWIVGLGNSQGGPVRATVTGNLVTLGAGFATGSNRAGMRDIYFSGSTGCNFDFATLASSGSNVLELQNVGMNGDMTFIANGAADFLDWITGRVFGNIVIDGGNAFLQQVYSAGGTLTTRTNGPQSLSADFLSCTIAGNITATSSGGKTNTTRLLSCSADGLVTADQANTTLVATSGSITNPTSLSVTNGAAYVSKASVSALYANKRAGNLTLVAGTVTIADTSVTANTLVYLTKKTQGGGVGSSVTYTLNPGVGFTVTSNDNTETSTFSYILVEKL